MQYSEEAEELNNKIKKDSETAYSLLSERGKAIFFPKKGILSQTAEANGKKINATIGIALEDDASPMRLKSIESMIKISPEAAFSYAPSYGRRDLREKWKQLLYKKNLSLNAEISLPVVTNALTHGLSMLGYLFVDANNKIIIPNLYWENYDLIFSNAYNAKLIAHNLFNNDKLDLLDFKDKIQHNKNKKIIVMLNFPNNPAGYTPTKNEVKEIVSILRETANEGKKLLVIIDDAYFGLVYEDDIEKESIFSYLTDIHKNLLAVKIDGATKEDYVWGFRVGFITFGIKNGTKELYDALESKAAGAVRGNISNAPNLSQSLILKAFESSTYKMEKNEKYNLLKSRYEEVKKVLRNEKYLRAFKPLPFNSGYFMCIELMPKLNAEEVRQLLLKKYDTGVICFGNLLRIAFSSVKKEKIKELFENIYSACLECDKNDRQISHIWQ